MNITEIKIRTEADFKQEIETEYKTKFWEEPENRAHNAEILRAKWVLWTERNRPDILDVLRAYNVQNAVIQELVGETPLPPAPKERRADKYDKLVDWCKNNHLYQTNANEVAEVGEISYPTALKFIKDRPDLFYKIKKGVYEVRNPDVIRAEENASL